MCELLLSYPHFYDVFKMHTDASATQLGAVISQKGIPIAFYRRKFNLAQARYTTTTECKLFARVLGQQLHVYTIHKNLTYMSFNTDPISHWRLVLKDFSLYQARQEYHCQHTQLTQQNRFNKIWKAKIRKKWQKYMH